MHTDTSDTPFRSAFADHERETEQMSAKAESDCPFGGAGFSISDLPAIPEDTSQPAYLKMDVTENAVSPSREVYMPKQELDPLISPEFTIEELTIVHVPSGMQIHDQKIDVLSFSSRSYNALRRGGIEMLVQLASLTFSDLQRIKNLGKNSAEEVISKLNQFLSEYLDHDMTDRTAFDHYGMPESMEMLPILSEETLVEDTALSVRAKNCLQRNGIATISELLKISAEELSGFSNLGKKTLHEILAFQEDLQEKLLLRKIPDESLFSPEILGFLDEFLEEVRILEIENKHLRGLLFAELHDGTSDRESCFFCWMRETNVQKKLRAYVKHCVKKHSMFGITAIAILEMLPATVSTDMLSGLLKDMTENGELVQQDGIYYPSTVSALDVLREADEERYAEILEKRMNQYTLEEIAEQYGLTRERVRQLQAKALRIVQHERQIQDILLTEERFMGLYEAYHLSQEEFCALTGVHAQTYEYLQLVSKKGDTSPEMIVYDDELPRWIRNNWIRYVRNSATTVYVYLPEENHRRISKTRPDIEMYILSKYCQDDVSLEEFAEYYRAFLSAHHLEAHPHLQLTESELRTRENKLSQSEFVLWKHGKKLRYYNIHAKDYTELLQVLDLVQYHNTEISTLKLFRDHPELMRQYDLRDEYELHNLLKKIGAESENPTMHFERTPGIRFGEYDREQMIKEKLFELAPIRTEDFAAIISEECGFSIAQVTAWFKCIQEYQRNGCFSVDAAPMSDVHMALLKRRLTEDFYFFSEIKAIYQELVPHADVSLISSFNLKRMGFVVNSTYVVQHYDSASKFFEHLLTQADVQDILPLSKKYGYIMSFSSKLGELKDDYEIIEFAPYQFIHFRKLQKMRIEKEHLKEYCDAVDAFVKPGVYFTVEYLQKQGFASPLDDLGFEAWFYSSILREDDRFSYTKLGGTVLFCKEPHQPITEQTFLISIMQQFGAIRLDELLHSVYDSYHLTLDKEHVRWNIKDTEMYYDDIMGKLYRNYDMYFEELESIDEDDWMESEEF